MGFPVPEGETCMEDRQQEKRASGAADRPHTFALLEENERLQAAAGALCRAGLRQLPAAQAGQAEILLLGLPLPSLQPWAAQLAAARRDALLFAGQAAPEARQQAAAEGLRLVDYLQSEELALWNAIPTAEAALGILLAATPGVLWRSRVALVGYGRIAQLLAPRLAALGARVTVVARSPTARALAEAQGLHSAAFDALPRLAQRADFVVNTVPACVLTAEALQALPKSAFVLDLASAPGGVDAAAARRLGVRVQQATGLPGKWAPQMAGQAIGQTILQFLQRQAEALPSRAQGGEALP